MGCFSESSDCCIRIMRGILVVSVMMGLFLSCYVLIRCDFLQLEFSPAQDNDDNYDRIVDELLDDDDILHLNSTITVRFGLLRYESPQDGECLTYPDYNTSYLSRIPMQFARVNGFLATTAALLATLWLWMEFLCGFCKFCCCRIWIACSLVVAMIAQAMTFCIFASSSCRGHGEYRCDVTVGAVFPALACGVFLLSALFSCVVPKPIPMLVKLRQIERQRNDDDDDDTTHKNKPHPQDTNHTDTEPPNNPQPPPPPVYRSSVHEQPIILEDEQVQDDDLRIGSGMGIQYISVQRSTPATEDVSQIQDEDSRAAETVFSNAEVVEGDLFFDVVSTNSGV